MLAASMQGCLQQNWGGAPCCPPGQCSETSGRGGLGSDAAQPGAVLPPPADLQLLQHALGRTPTDTLSHDRLLDALGDAGTLLHQLRVLAA